jgi:hypothetical protein
MPSTVRTDLEDRLEALTREFVVRLVAAIRNASFADVAALSAQYGKGAVAGRASSAKRPVRRAGRGGAGGEERPPQSGRVRQTAERRAELSERVLKTLQGAGGALGVRALSTALGVAPDLLAAPLRELRDKGRIQKHGDKRATTYSV